MQTKKITALLFPKLKKMILMKKMVIFFIEMMMSHQKKKVNSISVIVFSRINKSYFSSYIDFLSQCLVNVSDRLAAKLARKDSLALKLSQRPQRQELIERNILQMVRTIYFIHKNQSRLPYNTHHMPVHHSITLSFRIGIR